MVETIEFNLNRKKTRLRVEGERKLLWVLRTDLGLTGPKYGCGEGLCGSCTVLINQKAVRSCRVPVREVRGKEVLTIEGLSVDGRIHPVQKAFIEHNAFQCGFCTSGMILNACSLLLEKPRATEAEIIQGMNDNLCRCASHLRIVQAVLSAAEELRGGRKG